MKKLPSTLSLKNNAIKALPASIAEMDWITDLDL